ncbi:MAG: PAS domain-containing protein [Sphingomonas sp.]
MQSEIETLIVSDGELLSTVLDQTHDCIKVLDQAGQILYVNQQGAAAMELSSSAELVGQSWVDRWPAEVRPKVHKALTEARDGTPARFTASRFGPSGGLTWWDVTVSPVRSHHGDVTRFLTIARDMTAEVVERERVRVLSLEMRHRLQNALTVAAGLVAITARGKPELRSFADELVTRFGQLAHVQSMILSPGGNKQLKNVVSELAAVYGDAISLAVNSLGEIHLSDQAMQVLALCFGELATNSMKYGALRDGKQVHVEGRERGRALELVWREETIFGTARDGSQGLDLCQRLATAAGGSFERTVDPGRMQATITLPPL